MGWRGAVLAAVLAGCAAGALADAPATSARPVVRPVAPAVLNPDNPGQGAAISFLAPAASGAGAAVEGGIAASPRPMARPSVAVEAVPHLPVVPRVALASTSAAAISPVPKARKGLFGFLKAGAVRTQPDTGAITGRAGSVCGVPGIKGRTIAPISSRVRGCGVADPVEVTSVDGIALTEAATMDCPTAVALNSWVHGAVKPAFAGKGGGLEALRVAAHYICRPRNNVRGAPISEHGKGKAIDISGFLLASGAEVTVAGDYRRGGYSGALKAVHHAACGPFGTTLGPGSDGKHEDHIHMDTAGHRSGSYCR